MTPSRPPPRRASPSDGGLPDLDDRAAGLLLHPTSLPGPRGGGELGSAAHAFVDFAARAGARWWQMLPVGPTGYGNSPYQSPSGHAGNPALVDLGALAAEGWLGDADLAPLARLAPRRVSFGRLIPLKQALLARAAAAFLKDADGEKRGEFERFCAESASWLEDYAAFMALKDAHGGRAWTEWSGSKSA